MRPGACREFILGLDAALWPQAWPWRRRAVLTGAVLGVAVSVAVALLMGLSVLIAVAVAVTT
jgi:hypothetical protein